MKEDENRAERILGALGRHPELAQQIELLLATVDNLSGDLVRADDAEDRLVDDVRRIGQQAMQSWALNQVDMTEQEVRRSGRAHREGKKTELAHYFWCCERSGAAVPQR